MESVFFERYDGSGHVVGAAVRRVGREAHGPVDQQMERRRGELEHAAFFEAPGEHAYQTRRLLHFLALQLQVYAARIAAADSFAATVQQESKMSRALGNGETHVLQRQ